MEDYWKYNTLSQNDGCEMFLRESKCEDDVENIQENPSLQTIK
jgi:hypothetical protein